MEASLLLASSQQAASTSASVSNEDSDSDLMARLAVAVVKHRHDEAKAVKSDDAEVPVHLWDRFITRGQPVTEKIAESLSIIRQAALGWYRRKILRDCATYMRTLHGVEWYTHKEANGKKKADKKWAMNIQAIREIVEQAANNEWFEYPAGSRVHYFRFPRKYRSIARDGVPVFFTKEGPSSIRAQPNMADNAKAVLKNKIIKMWKKKYLDVPPTKLKSAIKYFAVPKGIIDNVVQDWRVVYHAGANGLNDSIWAPNFFLPSVDSLLRIVDESSFMEDRDVGEMFLNFELHHTVRKFTGVDVKPLGLSEQECPHRWLWWTKNFMGFWSSPYNSVKMYLIAEEVIRGDRLDGNNPFRWDHIELNLPGCPNYQPARSWISKRQVHGKLASDIVVFVDNKRLAGSGSDEVKEAGHAASTRESYLGLQDALRKWRSAGGTRTPGAWAGVLVVHIDKKKGILVLTSQEKWDHMKSICRHWLELLEAGETTLDFKQLQSDRGFMVYVTQAYPAMKPYLKGFHLSLETWRGGRDTKGWKIKVPTPAQEAEIHLELQEDEHDLTDEEKVAAGVSGPGPESGITMAVPCFRNDLKAILAMAESDSPIPRVVRSSKTLIAYYGFGDASSNGFGATIERANGIQGRYGLWSAQESEQSSNFRELANLVKTIEEEGIANHLQDTELWLFTDNSTAEGCFV